MSFASKGAVPFLLMNLLLGLGPCGRKVEPDVPDLAGSWAFTLRSSRGEIRAGVANIAQRRKQSTFSIAGRVENLNTKELEVVFSSKIAGIDGQEAFFVYENADRELGVAVAVIPKRRPTALSFRYYDCYGFDENDDPKGVLEMQRIEQEEELQDE